MAKQTSGHHQRAVNKFTSEDRFFSAIGRLIFEFSQLEYTLKHHISERIGLGDEYFDALMTHDFAMLCTIAESVLTRESKDIDVSLFPSRERLTEDGADPFQKKAADLKKLIGECRLLNDDRVRIVHGLWYIGSDTTPSRARLSLTTSTNVEGVLSHISRQKLKRAQYFAEATDIAKKADRACHLRGELTEILYRV